MKPKKQKPYVQYETIWKSVGGGLSSPGASKICRVGKHKVLVQRDEKLDRNGNPVHTATVFNGQNKSVASARGNGSLTLTVSTALKKAGVETKHKRRFPKTTASKKK